MRLKLILITLFILINHNEILSQCNCIWTGNTHQGEPEVYHNFKKGCTIGICSPIYMKDDQKDYCNSGIIDCSNNEIISEFEYGEINNVFFEMDTFRICTFYELPIGKNYQNIKCLFKTRMVSCDSEKLLIRDVYNKGIKLYSLNQINNILKEFKMMDKTMSDNDFYLTLDKLLMCYLSGSNIAINEVLKIKSTILNWSETKEYRLKMTILPRYEKFRKYLDETKE